MVKDIAKQKPATQHTVTSFDKSVTFYLDDKMQLLLKPHSAPYPYVIDVTTVHALANVLMTEYKEIVKAASKFNGVEKPGRSKATESKWS